jgi:hypothetical protein
MYRTLGVSATSLMERGREESFCDEGRADFHDIGIVHCQDVDCDAAHGRLPDQKGTIPAKMAFPFAAPRLEQFGRFLRVWIDPRDVRTFMVVVVQASKREVAKHGGAAVLLGDDVVDRERHRWVERPRQYSQA